MAIQFNNAASAAQFLREVAGSSVKAGENIKSGAGLGYVGVINGHAVKLATHYGERHGSVWRENADQLRAASTDLAASLRSAAEKLLDPNSKAFKKISAQIDSLASKQLVTRSVALKVVQDIQKAQGEKDCLNGVGPLKDVKGAGTVELTTAKYLSHSPRVRVVSEKLADRLQYLMKNETTLDACDSNDLRGLKSLVGKDLSRAGILTAFSTVVEKEFGATLTKTSVTDEVRKTVESKMPDCMSESVRSQTKQAERSTDTLNAKLGIAPDFVRQLTGGVGGPVRNTRLNSVPINAEKEVLVSEESRGVLEGLLGPVIGEDGKMASSFTGGSSLQSAYDKTGTKCSHLGSCAHEVRSLLPEGDYRGVMMFLTTQMSGCCGLTGLINVDENNLDLGCGSVMDWIQNANSPHLMNWNNIYNEVNVEGDKLQLRHKVLVGPDIGKIGKVMLSGLVNVPLVSIEETMTFSLKENAGLKVGEMPKGIQSSFKMEELV